MCVTYASSCACRGVYISICNGWQGRTLNSCQNTDRKFSCIFFHTRPIFYQPLNTSTPTVETFQLLHKSKRGKINEKGKLVPSPLVLACPIRKASMEECKRVEFCNCTANSSFLSVAVIRKYG